MSFGYVENDTQTLLSRKEGCQRNLSGRDSLDTDKV